MSEEIQDLIASIQQKFDHEFKHSVEHSTAEKSQRDSQEDHNPETGKNSKFMTPLGKNSVTRKQEIVIEDDHQNQEISYQGDQQRECKEERDDEENQNKLERGEGEGEDQGEGEGDQDNENKYKDLSHKLQTALKKISSSKNGFQTSRSSTGGNMLNRFEDYQRKKIKGLEEKRKIEEQKKYHGLKSKPDINANSQKIAQETSYRPIYERFDKILDDKKRKQEQNAQDKKAKEDQEYEQFLNEFKKHSKLEPESCRDTQAYFNDMILWKQKLNREREQKLKQKDEKEKERHTFKPVINQKSVRMLKNQIRVPIHEREIERPKTKQSEYSFQPKINKRILK